MSTETIRDHDAERPEPVVHWTNVALCRQTGDARPILEAVNWRVEPGSFWIIGGGHWSGKSLLLAAVAGLHPIHRGKAYLFGQDSSRPGDAALEASRRRVGLVFENGGRLFSHLSVFDNVALPLCYHRNCRRRQVEDRVADLLERLELADCRDATPERLDRAHRQRAALARTLALEPELLLLDNPTAGLGPGEARWWRAFLDSAQAGAVLAGGQQLTLVVACDHLSPWLTPGRRTAVIEKNCWRILDDQASLRETAAAIAPGLL